MSVCVRWPQPSLAMAGPCRVSSSAQSTTVAHASTRSAMSTRRRPLWSAAGRAPALALSELRQVSTGGSGLGRIQCRHQLIQPEARLPGVSRVRDQMQKLGQRCLCSAVLEGAHRRDSTQLCQNASRRLTEFQIADQAASDDRAGRPGSSVEPMPAESQGHALNQIAAAVNLQSRNRNCVAEAVTSRSSLDARR